MYDQDTYAKVSAWFDTHKEDMIRDIRRLVQIPSISRPGEDGKPFGQGCADALELMLQIGREHGFHTENYEDYVGSIGGKEKNWKNLIGFWNHLDVVPVGEGWEYPPFGAVRKGDFIIGRGSDDNKGSAVGMLYVMECVRELGLPVGHELCLFVGCDEERGMEDVAYYSSHHPMPALSMISDCGFPVCYGEKGILEGKAVSEGRMSGAVLDFHGGNAGNVIPDRAWMVLRKEAVPKEKRKSLAGLLSVEAQGDQVTLLAEGVAGHSAFPEGSCNAIHKLCQAVAQANFLCEGDQRIVERIERATAGNYGEEFGIGFEDELSGRLTCAGTVLGCREGQAELTFNIRYSITACGEQIAQKLADYWKKAGFVWITDRDSAPNYFDPSHPAVERLTAVYNKMTGRELAPYTMGGGTYARKLPNAFGFGLGNMPEQEGREKPVLQPGHGGAHGPDEMLDCGRLTEALKIYVMGLLAIEDIPLVMSGSKQPS